MARTKAVKQKAKTRKSVSKRFKITRTGKVFRRAVGQDHYLSKQSPKSRRGKSAWIKLAPEEAKKVKKFLID